MVGGHFGRKRHNATQGLGVRHRKYPWYRLAAPGDTFTWRVRSDEGSLRAQASNQAKARGWIITVHKAEVGQPAFIVRYVRNVL